MSIRVSCLEFLCRRMRNSAHRENKEIITAMQAFSKIKSAIPDQELENLIYLGYF